MNHPQVHHKYVFFKPFPWVVYGIVSSTLMQSQSMYVLFVLPSGKRLHNYGKIHHAINGKTHYFYGHFQ